MTEQSAVKPPPVSLAPMLSRPALGAELLLAFWLLLAGVNKTKWRAAAAQLVAALTPAIMFLALRIMAEARRRR